MLSKNVGLMILVGLFFSACSIKQEVNPVVTTVKEKKVCIVENKAVKEGFLTAYKEALEAKKYKVEVVDENASLKSCVLSSSYTARWSWDVAVFMSFAEIEVFNNGKLVGDAVYDSRSASANMGKFISAEKKVKELVGELFPE